MVVAVITGAVMAGAATIRYPVKQPYRLSGIYNFLHFTIKLLHLKFPYFPIPNANYQARPWYVYTPYLNEDSTLIPTPNEVNLPGETQSCAFLLN